MGLAGRPINPVYWAQSTTRYPGILERMEEPFEVGPPELYLIAKECNAVRKSIQALRDYIFKEGYEWVPKFSKKCKACQFEHPSETDPEFCANCGSGKQPQPQNQMPASMTGNPMMGTVTVPGQAPEVQWYDSPNENEVKQMEKFFEKTDIIGHTFIQTLKMFEDHLNIVDDAFLISLQDYELVQDDVFIDPETEKIYRRGDVYKSEIKEIIVADSKNFKFIMDNRTMVPGGMYYICLNHRPTTRNQSPQTANLIPKGGKVSTKPGTCDHLLDSGEKCGMKLHDVWYVSHAPGSKEQILEYYIGPEEETGFLGEVIHSSKYSDSYGYGYAPGVSIYNMARLLMSGERYMKTFYDEERTPRSAIFIPTTNPDGVMAAWKKAEDTNVSQEGHYVPKFTYNPAEGKVPVQYIEFSKLPAELQHIEQRDECYRRIGSAYGVDPVFHGNTNAVGQQQQGPTMWNVTTLAAQIGQGVYNDTVLPRVLKWFGIKDWKLRLKEVEERDDMQKWQVKMLEANYAQQMQVLGFGATGRDSEGHFIFPKRPQMQPGMGMGGMMGGFGAPQMGAAGLGMSGTPGIGAGRGGQGMGSGNPNTPKPPKASVGGGMPE